MTSLKDLNEILIAGDFEKSKNTTQNLIEQGITANDILNKGLLPGMEIVGQRFRADEMFIPEVLMSARVMDEAMEIIKPILLADGYAGKETIVLGTVKGDIHTIGKDIVGMMLEGAGYKIIDVGFNIENDKFVEAVKKNDAKIVGLSALLTTTMPVMKEIIDTLRADSETKEVKVIVGGAPVTQEYSESIGADGYAYDAIKAVEIVEKLL
ncbi:B12-binding domain-containing protein [Actinomycetota bacterium]